MDVFIADLEEETAAIGEEFARDSQPVAEIRQVGVDAEFPCISECANLFGLECHVLLLRIADVWFSSADLPVASEFDAVRRIEVYRLHLAFECFLLGEGVHDEEGVAKDEAIVPVLFVLIELDAFLKFEGTESLKERFGLAIFLYRHFSEHLNYGFGLDVFLRVNRHGMHAECVGILFVFAFPDELRV